jgi:hypothetical protein
MPHRRDDNYAHILPGGAQAHDSSTAAQRFAVGMRRDNQRRSLLKLDIARQQGIRALQEPDKNRANFLELFFDGLKHGSLSLSASVWR